MRPACPAAPCVRHGGIILKTPLPNAAEGQFAMAPRAQPPRRKRRGAASEAHVLRLRLGCMQLLCCVVAASARHPLSAGRRDLADAACRGAIAARSRPMALLCLISPRMVRGTLRISLLLTLSFAHGVFADPTPPAGLGKEHRAPSGAPAAEPPQGTDHPFSNILSLCTRHHHARQ